MKGLNPGVPHWIEVNSYRHRTKDLLTDSRKTNYERMAEQPTLQQYPTFDKLKFYHDSEAFW